MTHRLHFGLGAVARVDMEVRWPDGTVQTLADVAADQILRLVIGSMPMGTDEHPRPLLGQP